MLIESGLLRTIGISTLIATKAARLAIAANGASLSDFSFRRAHEPYLAARSGYIGGCDSTSFLAAAYQYDIPPAGTIPHALVQAFPDEMTAFRAVAEIAPRITRSCSTPTTSTPASNTPSPSPVSPPRYGHHLRAVRLDSGDIAADSRHCRTRLDDEGFTEVSGARQWRHGRIPHC